MNNEQIDKAVANAMAVYSDSCNHTREAIDYLANVLRANLPVAAPAAAGTIDTPIMRYKRDSEGMIVDDPEGGFVFYIDHLQHRAAAVAEAEKKHAARIAHLTHERDLARRAADDLSKYLEQAKAERAATAPVSAAEQAAHETIVQQDGELVCTACGTTAKPADGQELPAIRESTYGYVGMTGALFAQRMQEYARAALAMRQPQGEDKADAERYRVLRDSDDWARLSSLLVECCGSELDTALDREIAAKQAGKESQ